jgi:hypothetical protein
VGVVKQKNASKRKTNHPSLPLEARMIAPITEVIETALEMSSKSIGFIGFFVCKVIIRHSQGL